MATRINRAKAAAEDTSVPIKLVIGHGVLARGYSRVPSGRHLIYVGKPGHFLAQSVLTVNPEIYNENYIRGVLTRRIRRTTVRPVQLANWTSHLYGPGDIFPELEMTLYDADSEGRRLSGTLVNKLTGVRNLHTGQVFGKGKPIKSLVGMMKDNGPGIYIVFACRASLERATTQTRFMSPAAANFAFDSTRRMTKNDPLLNRWVQLIENKQRRYAKFKRSATSPSSPPSAKRQKPMFQFAPGATNTGHRTSTGNRIFVGPMGGMYTLTRSGQRRAITGVLQPATRRRSRQTRAR